MRFFLTSVICLFSLASCQFERPVELHEFTGLTMGTSWSVKINAETLPLPRQQLKSQFDAILDRVNGEMSTYLPESELSIINAGHSTDPIPVSPSLMQVLEAAREISRLTQGAFDVTVGPLVNLWGFGPGQDFTIPTGEQVRRASALAGFEKLRLDPAASTLKKANGGVSIDLSAIAKGHGVDRVADYLDSMQLDGYLVEIGGEIRARGVNREQAPWQIGIEQPVPGQRGVQRIIKLDNMAMATSGDYRNFFEQDGIRYSHTIDPRTGRPVTHDLASVTVLHPSAMLADAWATGLLVLGLEQGYATVLENGLDAYFIVHHDKGFREKSTPGFQHHRIKAYNQRMTHLSASATALKNEVIEALRFQGFIIRDDTFHIPKPDKSNIRNIHSISRAERITEHINFIERFTPNARQFMLDSSELDVSKISPRLITVQSRSEHEKLFRWWNFTWWSLPYERSYGRQLRFIVWDDYHNAPIGIIGLQSPILSWSVRDNYLGISKDMRDFWINQSMNAQRLGALPPYNRSLGGKLVALLLTCDEIRKEFYEKYKNYETLLKKRNIPANLLFVTTTGAYGKSSVYNRLRFNGRRVCDFIGYTHGSGSFHIPNTLYEGFVNYLRENDIKAGRSFGNGPSVKMKIINRTMGELGFKTRVEHGIKRAVYLFPYAQNIKAVIHQGEPPLWEKRDVESLTKYWKQRWAIKRVGGYPEEKLMFSKEKFLCEIEQDLTRSKNLVTGAQP